MGAGVWKFQNPDGTVDDFKNQAQATSQRLKAGLDAGVATIKDQPATINEQQARQQDINERLAALEQSQQDLDDEAEETRLQELIDSQLAETRSQVQLLQNNSTTLSSSVDSLQGSVGELQSDVAQSVSSSLATLESKLDKTSAGNDAGIVRLDAIERRLELLVRRLDEQTADEDLKKVSESVDNLGDQLTQLESESRTERARLAIDIAGIAEKNDTLGLRIDTFGGSRVDDSETDQDWLAMTSGIDDRLSALETKLSNANTDASRVNSLADQLEAANQKIAELEASAEVSASTLSAIGGSLEELQTVGESLSIDTVQAEIQDQLARAQEQFENSQDNTDTEELDRLLESTRNRIQTLEQRVQELPASSSEADEALQAQSALQSQIAALERRVEDVSSTDPALESTVQDVKERVEELSARQESKSVEYKIYFDRNSADITEDAADVLNSFITQEQNRTTGVSIFGFTDRSGSAAYNQQLALQRATNVRSFLIQNGLDYTKIKALSGLGEDAAAAVLPDESADAQQRVVVLYADQP